MLKIENPWLSPCSIPLLLFLKRIHQIELFVKYPNEVQQEVLQDLVGMAKTKMGYKHDFSSINNYKVFSQRVPIVQYEAQRN